MKRYLILEDGTVFEGEAFGACVQSIGELVFTTGMCGYIETLTDPSYCGQIVLHTFPLIGNYGVIESDFEGDCHIKGYIVREWCDTPSNFRSQYDIDKFLKDRGVPGICSVDTRQLTRIIREQGVMNTIICDSPDLSSELLERVKNYRVGDAVNAVTCKEPLIFPANGEKKFNVAVLDLGVRSYIIDSLSSRGCKVTVVPATTCADDILALSPDGVVISNGPGDPAQYTGIISEISALFGRVPLFGIGLGHQLMALCRGAVTLKLKYGHRGANQPVKDLAAGRTIITEQNHGYAVDQDSITDGCARFVNANDMTVEGIDYPESRAFSVQFYPESCPPHGIQSPFDRFCSMMEGGDL